MKEPKLGAVDKLNRVFIYGTLIPGQVRWDHLAEYVQATEPDSTAGLLYSTPYGYPAARFDGTNTLPQQIQGQLMTIRPELLDECFELLDEVESAVVGLYHRVVVETSRGHKAWSYQYGIGIDNLELIQSGSWMAHIGQ